MVFKISKGQQAQFDAATARSQLERAARDLTQRTKGDFDTPTIRRTLDEVALEAEKIGIQRIKYLKILTLWRLYPSAAPETAALKEILAGSGTQDIRMRAAMDLPLPYKQGTA